MAGLQSVRRRTRVPTSVDPEQSNVVFMGGTLLAVSVFVSIENQLDIEAQLRPPQLAIVMTDGSTRDTRPDGFSG